MQCRQSSTSNMILYSQREEFPPIEALCGNSLMIKLTQSTIDSQSVTTIKEIQADNLNLIEKLTDGLFGSIHLAEMQLINNEKQNVLVKFLNDNVDEKQK